MGEFEQSGRRKKLFSGEKSVDMPVAMAGEGLLRRAGKKAGLTRVSARQKPPLR